MEERVRLFRERGMEVAQGGSWKGDNHFAFWESRETGTYFETIQFAPDWDYPEPDEWFPVPPAELKDEEENLEEEEEEPKEPQVGGKT